MPLIGFCKLCFSWVAACLLVFLCSSAHALAASKETASAPLSTEAARLAFLMQSEADKRPLPFPIVNRKQHPHLDHLYQYDNSPLAGRWPLIIVPGRAEERQYFSWWQRVFWVMDRHPELQKRFKPFVYMYDSSEALEMQTHELEQELRALLSYTDKRSQLVMATYSLGGLVARDTLLENPDLLERTHTIYGIGVPYQGSPMFNTRWFSHFSRHISPIRRFMDMVFYHAYVSGKAYLNRSMRWVNFDQSEPIYEKRSKILAQGKSGQNEALESPHLQAFKKKLVIYASYLDNPYVGTKKTRFNRDIKANLLQVPKTVLGTVLPFYGFTVHSLFDYVNIQMANLPTYTPLHPRGENTHLYRYNDGVIPISSAMYLPPRLSSYKEGINELYAERDVCQMRIFRNLDHVDLGHYRLFEKQLEAADQFHPEEGKHIPLEWLLTDMANIKADSLACQAL